MCIEMNAILKLQIIEDKMVKLIPLSDEDVTFLKNQNMQERIDLHQKYIQSMQDLKDTENEFRKLYGDDIINKLLRGMPLS